MHFEFYVLAKYYPVLLKGAVVTIEYTVMGLVTSLIFGTLVAVLRTAKVPVLDPILRAYINVCREVPLLVQIYFVFFAMPSLGVTLSASVAALVSITLNEGAFIAEIVRGGIQSIPRGQWEAAGSIGMSGIQAMRYIILPQAMRKIIPTLVGHSSYVLKDTAVLTVIAIEEVTSAAGYINDMTLSPLTAFGSAAVIYVLLFWVCQFTGARIERFFEVRGSVKWT